MYAVFCCGILFEEFALIDDAIRMALALYFALEIHYCHGISHCWLLECLAKYFNVGENPDNFTEKLALFRNWYNI